MNACTLQPEQYPDKPSVEDDSTLAFRRHITELIERCEPPTH
jgi:hypothetical protein